MIVVSGCPRSGTSLMMDIVRVLLGDDRILGQQFPQRAAPAKEGPSDDPATAYIEYVRDKLDVAASEKRNREKAVDMNPRGFWEGPFTVGGLHRQPSMEPFLRDHVGKAAKIVSSGLAVSDPQFIEKIIFMVRHPDNVAKSQERLKRPGFNDRGDPQVNGQPVRIFSYDMFNQSTVAAANWITLYNPTLILVNYDNLVDDPQSEVARVAKFIAADADKVAEAAACVTPGLRRSVEIPSDGECRGRELAYRIYTELVGGSFQKIREEMDEVRRIAVEKRRKENRKHCTRLDRMVVDAECLLCRSDEATRRNYRNGAVERGIHWEAEPCAYDCLVKGKTLDASIAENHWIESGS